jgi:MoxR-like ATPase
MTEKTSAASAPAPVPREKVARFQADCAALRQEIGKVIVGNHEIVEGVLTCLLAGGHALLEGVPGLGKTLLVRTMAQALDLHFSRIQFTPDLMPADIIGTTVISDDPASGGKKFEFRKGPLFAHMVLADEINRATPKTQSALLEAMQEQSITVAKTTYALEPPFFVLATQNPLEMEGTYPLPEAQLDRFLFKLHVRFPGSEELHAILDRTTGNETPDVRAVVKRDRILELKAVVREVPAAPLVRDYTVQVLQATHPDSPSAVAIAKRFVRFGASPRGAQAILLGAKVSALLDGRFAPSIEDVKKVVKPSLRHRIILNFEGEAEGVKTDDVIEEILKTVAAKKV